LTKSTKSIQTHYLNNELIVDKIQVGTSSSSSYQALANAFIIYKIKSTEYPKYFEEINDLDLIKDLGGFKNIEKFKEKSIEIFKQPKLKIDEDIKIVGFLNHIYEDYYEKSLLDKFKSIKNNDEL